ncbi:solute carrier family 13 member 2-like isoform X2 [Clavelina lepadiformis]
MAIYWTTEACPLAVTSLLPVVLFPILGIQTADKVSMSYMRQLNFLFMGGLIIAVAIEEWNLHRRIALKVLLLIGAKPCWVLLGFMSVTALLSMWISNTATTAMMIPIAMAVHKQMTKIQVNNSREDELQENSPLNPEYEENEAMETSDDKVTAVKVVIQNDSSKNTNNLDVNLRKAMLLCVAYAANIGGFATLIGTPANLILPGVMESVYGEGASDSVDFVSWLGFSFPVSITCLVVTWFWLQIRFTGLRNLWAKGDVATNKRVSDYLKKSYEELGPIKFGEFAVLGHFLFLAILWLTRDPKVVDGWMDALGLSLVKDSTCAMLVSFSLFVFPSKNPLQYWRKICCTKCVNQEADVDDHKPSSPLLKWKTAQARLAWDVVLLLGAGFALARACEDSKLTDWVGDKMSGLTEISPAAFAVIVSITVSLLTEFTSNVSTASIFLPVACKLASHAGIHPLYIAVPATISCSFAFSLPVATPPNAIAFSYGSLRVRDLVTTGLVLNFICIGILNMFLNITGIPIFQLNAPSSLLLKSTVESTVQDNHTMITGRNI